MILSKFDDLINLERKAMDFRNLRQDIIASNVANVNTPNYNASGINFETNLKAAAKLTDDSMELKMADTNPRHLAQKIPTIDDVQPLWLTCRDFSLHNDLNSVDLDQEMARMSENNILYAAVSGVIKKRLAGMNDLITTASSR
ncbi:MAG: flagellar basal body rod protein FlgB [Deltaproteobacteria bacterium]|nr:flagellar basal body rod protein FlgB [Deltaproteobacteria bacterium]MBF0524540.1 flagellar basal body rod protein FlgB [Deltaproteobacteria bacterium]